MGIVFAISFCPVSAGLFFGGLIQLAIAHRSTLAFPALFGVATSIPVLAFAVPVALGAQWVGKAFNKLTQLERWARRITGVIFIGVGTYYSLRYIFEVLN